MRLRLGLTAILGCAVQSASYNLEGSAWKIPTLSSIKSMGTANDFQNASKALDLTTVRSQLIRLEDTIIFNLIERVQFPLNETIYIPGGVKIPDNNISLMDYVLREQERLHSRFRRYESLDEYPFFPDTLDRPIVQPLQHPKVLHDNDVNVNKAIRRRYVKNMLPALFAHFRRADPNEVKEDYWSAATCDVSVLQAISRRIHLGKFVAEAKFQENPQLFVRLIKAN
ncbi:hypothetical protein IFM61606_10571, partial [Aspergillus udagawae]